MGRFDSIGVMAPPKSRKQTDFVTLYFPNPLQHLAFTELKRRKCKRLLYSFLSKFRQLNIWRSTQVVEEA